MGERRRAPGSGFRVMTAGLAFFLWSASLGVLYLSLSSLRAGDVFEALENASLLAFFVLAAAFITLKLLKPNLHVAEIHAPRRCAWP